MLNILFFAQTRELIGVDAIQLEDDFATADEVREHLAQKGDKWALALEKGKLLVAINQTLMPLESAVSKYTVLNFCLPEGCKITERCGSKLRLPLNRPKLL